SDSELTERELEISGQKLTVSSLAQKSMDEVRKIADPLSFEQQQALFKAYRAAQNSGNATKILGDLEMLLSDDTPIPGDRDYDPRDTTSPNYDWRLDPDYYDPDER
ncbi:MAG: hypothetical protein AAFY41_07920, partial [Bacteroidota bacterium]